MNSCIFEYLQNILRNLKITISRIFTMTQTSMNTPYAKRVAEKFKEAQNYLKTNGFSRSTNHLLEEIENTFER